MISYEQMINVAIPGPDFVKGSFGMFLLSCPLPVCGTMGFGWLATPTSDLDKREMAALRKTIPTNSQLLSNIKEVSSNHFPDLSTKTT